MFHSVLLAYSASFRNMLASLARIGAGAKTNTQKPQLSYFTYMY